MKKFKEVNYPAIIRKEIDGTFAVSFPDFPGWFTFGYSYEEAERKGREVLSLWIEELSLSKEKIKVYKDRPIFSDIFVKIPA